MGYLDNTSVTIDAILTVTGRKLLSQGKFNITKFALGDDEIDYGLWNTNHPLGSSYYGVIIENMPILEAIPDDNSSLRSKLITLKKDTIKIPAVSTGTGTTIALNKAKTSIVFTPTTDGTASPEGYTLYTSNKTIITINGTTSSVEGIEGTTFKVAAAFSQFKANESKSCTVTIVDNMSGATTAVTINITNK